MKDIFEEIDELDNEEFRKFKYSELQHILELINRYNLVLRDSLNIKETETFGLEIECEHADREKILLSLLKNWKVVNDTSLNSGVEINSPILIDQKNTWDELNIVCDILSKYSIVGENCGGHIHIGKQIIEKKYDALINFMKIWSVYEHVIYRFAYGEFLGPRPKLFQTSKPVAKEFKELSKECELGNIRFGKLMYYLMNNKYQAVNFRHFDTLKTIEFRCPNATFNPVIWQNNINVFVKMLRYSNSINYDKEYINWKILYDKNYNNIDGKIKIDDALEFIDLIFDNNLDKVYFLRQYLKSFDESNQYKKANTFCKTR